MNFKEMIERYQAGTATEEEVKLIREELEKQKWLNELLYDELEEELDGTLGSGDRWQDGRGDIGSGYGQKHTGDQDDTTCARSACEAEQFSAVIRKAIRRAFIKAGAVVLTLGVAITVFLCYGLSPIVDMMYYDPGEELVYSEGESWSITADRLGVDMGVFTELNYPVCRFDGAIVTDRGFGNYSFQLYQGYRVAGMSDERIGGEIRRGVMTMFDNNVLDRPTINQFCNYGDDGAVNRYQFNEWKTYWEDDVRKAVNELDPEVCQMAYVSFDHILTFDELEQLKADIGAQNTSTWNLVETKVLRNDADGWSSSNGAQFGYWDGYGFSESETPEPTVRVIPDGMSYDEFQADEELQTAQFIKMLDYMAQQEEFVEMMGSRSEYYAKAADHVRENGMNFIGLAVYGQQAALQALLDHPLVSVVELP